MKNRRKIFQRAAAWLCCILLLPSFVAVPAHATYEDSFFNVLDFGTANDSGYQNVSGSLPLTVVYRTAQEPFKYVDMLVISDIPDMTVTYAGNQLSTSLIDSSSGYLYRVYGDLVGDPSGFLTFTFNGSSGSTVVFEQLRVTSLDFSQSIIQSTGRLWCNKPKYGIYYEDMASPLSDVRITFDIYESYDTSDFLSQITPFEWRNFDYVDLFVSVLGTSIDSITANLDYVSVPYTVTHLDSEYAFSMDDVVSELQSHEWNYKLSLYKMCIRLDLRGLDRSSRVDPYVEITGTYYPGADISQRIELTGVTGIICADAPSELGVFWQRLQGLLVGLFGSGSPAANETQQTQEEIDTEVNLQIVDAMADWEANIETVSVGFDSYFLSTQPALIWLGGLADRIFNNMGWFKNVFFTLGLFSIFMLILSKAGVAHSVGKYLRR